MDYSDLLRNRLMQLIKQKKVTDHKVSMDLGRSSSYIRGITSGRSLPSMSEFFYICEYFEITPAEFFNSDFDNPALISKAVDGMLKLDENDLLHLIYVINKFNINNTN